MDGKIAILLVLAVFLAFAGCAKKAESGATQVPQAGQVEEPSTPEGQVAPEQGQTDQVVPDAAPPDADEGQSGEPGLVEPDGGGVEPSDQELADLFRIDTDEPISDQGLDISGPSSSQ